MSLLHRKFYDSVVSINTIQKDGKIFTIGSGFLISHYEVVFLVTNVHVLKELKTFLINLNGSTSENKRFVIVKPGLGFKRFRHKNNKIDVELVEIPKELLPPNVTVLPFSKVRLSIGQMKDREIYEGDEIFIIGHPLNITRMNYLFPIVRSGSIAQISHLYNFSDTLMNYALDCIAFPGNSGGPVFLKPHLGKYKGSKPTNEMKLIGIINAILVNNNNGLTHNLELSNVIATDYIQELLNRRFENEE
jgi:S1-C subfamily serine protease